MIFQPKAISKHWSVGWVQEEGARAATPRRYFYHGLLNSDLALDRSGAAAPRGVAAGQLIRFQLHQ